MRFIWGYYDMKIWRYQSQSGNWCWKLLFIRSFEKQTYYAVVVSGRLDGRPSVSLELMTSCCNPMDLLHHLEKGKEELSPLQYHIKSLHIISRHYKKSLLRSQIYHGYEELSTDTNYPIWRRKERRSKYVVQLASWQLRSNSPKTSAFSGLFFNMLWDIYLKLGLYS